MGALTRTAGAELSASYGKPISSVASSFGASSYREARLHPGGFFRPVVGHDPDYWQRSADRATMRAIKADPELKEMYRTARYLGNTASTLVAPNKLLDGTASTRTTEFDETVKALEGQLNGMDIRFTVGGKWVSRTQQLSEFALRVIDSTGKLYQGLPEYQPENTAGYWQDILDQVS